MSDAMTTRREHMATTDSTPSASSFSLLDFHGELPNRIFVEDIINATEKLSTLQQVDHVDDISMDWDYVQGLLSQGLLATTISERRQYLDICTTWFDQADGMMRVQLTELLTDTVIIASEANDNVSVVRLLQAWRYMWIQILEKSLDPRRVDHIGTALLVLLKSNNQVATYLAILDPTVIWFHKWAQEQSPLQLRVIIMENGILAILLQRCEADTINRALRNQSLSILNIVLLHTRLSQFPWDDGIPQINRLASIFLTSKSPDGDGGLTDGGAQAVETMLWGSYQDEKLYRPVLEEILSRINFSGGLINVLRQVQEAVEPDSAFAVEIERIVNQVITFNAN